MRKQLAVRVDEDFLKEIKIKLAIEGKTFQDYVIELIKKDMEVKGNDK